MENTASRFDGIRDLPARRETLGWLQQTEPGVYRVLRDAVKAALDRLAADGTYAALLKKWKLDANAIPAIAINQGQ